MAKRAGFVPGFAELRGNISGTQDLTYPEKNNKAFEAPLDKRSYATNYRPSVVISHVARTGKFHFAIRTKSAVRRTARSTMAMALLGGAGALYGALIMNADKKAAMLAIWEHDTQYATYRNTTFQKFWMDIIRDMLKRKQETYARTVGGTITIYNPWVYEGGIDVTVSKDVLVKFWNELAVNAITFIVAGEKGVAHVGDTFNDVCSATYNVLGLTLENVSDMNYVKLETSYLKNSQNEYVKDGDSVTNGEDFSLTEVAPE